MLALQVEMPCVRVLARMELTGFGFSQSECETQKAVMQAKLAGLEEQAYQMAGRGFSLTSPEDIAQVHRLGKGREIARLLFCVK